LQELLQALTPEESAHMARVANVPPPWRSHVSTEPPHSSLRHAVELAGALIHDAGPRPRWCQAFQRYMPPR